MEPTTEELEKITRDAWKEGIFVVELGQAKEGTPFLAAAGPVAKLEELESRWEETMEANGGTLDPKYWYQNQDGKWWLKYKEFDVGMCMQLTAPGFGNTREDAAANAIDMWKKVFSEAKEAAAEGVTPEQISDAVEDLLEGGADA